MNEIFIIQKVEDITYFQEYMMARQLLREAREHIMIERAKLYFDKICYIGESNGTTLQ